MTTEEGERAALPTTSLPESPAVTAAAAGARALIVASTSLAIDLLGTIDTLYTGFEILSHVDTAFDAIAYTIRPLAEALYSAETILSSDPVRQIARNGRSEDRNIELWVALHETLNQCRLSLTQLEKLMEPLDPDSEHALEQKLELQNAMATSIPQIKLHAASLRMAVHMIDLRLSRLGSKNRPIHTSSAIDRLRTLMDMQIGVLREMARNPATSENFEKMILQEYSRSVGWAAQTLFAATSGTRRDSGIASCCHSRHGSIERSIAEESRPSKPTMETTSVPSIVVDEDSSVTASATPSTLSSVPGSPPSLSRHDSEEVESVASESEEEPMLDECPPPPCVIFEPEQPAMADGPEPLPRIKLCNDSERYYYEETLRLAGYDVKARNFDATAAMEKMFDRCRKQGNTPDDEMAGMIKVLLDVGADPRKKVQGVWKYFQKMQPIGWRPKQECDFLTAATVEGWDNIVGVFIERGTPLDTNSPAPLHIATREGNVAVASKLISAGADTRVRGRGNITPMHIAADKGQVEIMSLLITAGAPADDVGFWQSGTKFECTPLQLAIKNKHADAVTLLLQSGADADAKAAAGPERSPPPLHLACQDAQPQLVRLLLEQGANPNLEDGHGATPLLAARSCVALGTRSSSSETKRLRKDCQEVVRLLVQAGAEPDDEALETNLEGDRSWTGGSVLSESSGGGSSGSSSSRSRSSSRNGLRSSSPSAALRKMIFRKKSSAPGIPGGSVGSMLSSVVGPSSDASSVSSSP